MNEDKQKEEAKQIRSRIVEEVFAPIHKAVEFVDFYAAFPDGKYRVRARKEIAIEALERAQREIEGLLLFLRVKVKD